MRQAHGMLAIETQGRGLIDLTRRIGDWLAGEAIHDGLLTLFIRHTSASLVVQESASGDARADLERFFERIAPEGDDYLHADEGPDDMPAHLRSALTATQLSVPVNGGRMMLGTWQAIYLFEHRARPHRREVALHVIGN